MAGVFVFFKALVCAWRRQVLARIGASDDARVQRDAARALASLSVSEETKGNIILQVGVAPRR